MSLLNSWTKGDKIAEFWPAFLLLSTTWIIRFFCRCIKFTHDSLPISSWVVWHHIHTLEIILSTPLVSSHTHFQLFAVYLTQFSSAMNPACSMTHVFLLSSSQKGLAPLLITLISHVYDCGVSQIFFSWPLHPFWGHRDGAEPIPALYEHR